MEVIDPIQQRIKHVEDLLYGDEEVPRSDESRSSATARIAQLESRLASICSQHASTSALIRLYDRAPELLNADDFSEPDASRTSSRAPVVLTNAPRILALRSQLDTLESQGLPDVEPLIRLLAMRPHVAKVQAIHADQAERCNGLRAQTAALLAQWYQHSVLGDGEQWATWESRLQRIEQALRRRESAYERAQHET